MTTRRLIGVLIVFLLALAALSFAMPRSVAPDQSSIATSSPVQNPDVRLVVENFGRQMKDVSLLAPAPDVGAAMDHSYAPFLTPELRAAWEASPSSALGRTVSSPWPVRIVIDDASAQTDGTYLVHARVVEVTSVEASSGGVAAMYPVTMQLTRVGNSWLISAAQAEPYADFSDATTTTGTFGCLPHRDTSGPQTDECAYGLTTLDGSHYALDLSLLDGGPASFPTAGSVTVRALVTPAAALNANSWQQYDIAGIMQVLDVER